MKEVTIKALTLYQPWATLVAIGAKKIETRSWTTKYRGPLAIHSGMNFKFIPMIDREPFKKYLWCGDRCNTPMGVILATCILGGVWIIKEGSLFLSDQEKAFGDYSPGRYMWILENVRKLETPIPAKGKMGLWEWKEENHDRT